VVRRRSAGLVAAIAAVSVLAACSVRGQSSATRLKPEEVPFQLLNQTTTTIQTSTTQPANDTVQLYFVRDGLLAPVTREGVVADPQSVLVLLSAGPSDSESDQGMRSALVPELAAIVDIIGDVVTIDLNEEFSSLSPTEQRLALAQITYALTQLPPIDQVRFLVAGQAASVPRGDGSSTDGPVDQSDYEALAPQ
jgi:spore germination protein GerM